MHWIPNVKVLRKIVLFHTITVQLLEIKFVLRSTNNSSLYVYFIHNCKPKNCQLVSLEDKKLHPPKRIRVKNGKVRNKVGARVTSCTSYLFMKMTSQETYIKMHFIIQLEKHFKVQLTAWLLSKHALLFNVKLNMTETEYISWIYSGKCQL